MDTIGAYWKIWKPMFPEYKHSDTCVIVGMAHTSRDLAPFEDKTKDLWGLNEGLERDWFRRKDPTGWFQIHPVFDFMRKYNRNDPKHWNWLQQEHGFPIFMQNVFPDVPNSVAFPLRDLIQGFSMYSTSSPSYQMALAILMDYKRIELYGIEMSAHSEYVYQKACMEYYIGFARGRGIEVYLPPECSLLQGHLYGYEDLRAASRVIFQHDETAAKARVESKSTEMWEKHGRRNVLIDIMNDPKFPGDTATKEYVSNLCEQIDSEVMMAHQEYGVVQGELRETQRLIKWYDTQNIADERADIPEEQQKNAVAFKNAQEEEAKKLREAAHVQA